MQLSPVLWILSIGLGKEVKKIKSQNSRFLNAVNYVTDLFRDRAFFSSKKIEMNYRYLHHMRQSIDQKKWAISFSFSSQIASVSRPRGVLCRLHQLYGEVPGSRCLLRKLRKARCIGNWPCIVATCMHFRLRTVETSSIFMFNLITNGAVMNIQRDHEKNHNW